MKYHKKIKDRLISMILVFVLAAGCMFVPTTLQVSAVDNSLTGLLGSEWSVGWNGSDTPATDFVKIVKSGAKYGDYSLRIGHPNEDTKLTLKLSVPVETAGNYQYATWVKSVGTVESVTFYARDGASGTGTGNILEYDVTSLISTSWKQFLNSDNATDEDTDGSATELYVDTGAFVLDVGVTCDAGEYVYLDNVDVFATDAPTIQLNLDNSFERWSATNNVSGYNACEFMKITSDKASDGTKSLRIGHETLATDIVLKLYVPTVTGRTAKYVFAESDVYVEVPEGKNNPSVAKIDFRGYAPGTSTKNYRNVDLTKIPTSDSDTTMKTNEWYSFDRNNYIASDGSDVVTGAYTGELKFIYITITVKCEAGVYIYFDNFEAKVGSSKAPGINLRTDSSFESLELEPSPYILKESDEISPWYISWTGDTENRYQYISHNAYNGKNALAVSYAAGATSNTIAQKVTGLTAGDTYVLEAYVQKNGVFNSAKIFKNDNSETSSANVDIVNFTSSNYTDWTLVTGTFVPTDSDTIISIYSSAPQGSILLVDAVCVYNQNDATKTNLIENGSFGDEYTRDDVSLTSGLVMPDNWTVSWNNNPYKRYVYRSNEANSGEYALAIDARENSIKQTLKQSISTKIEAGVDYTVEGYFKKIGTFSTISLMETASGAGNSTFCKLQSMSLDDYTLVTTSFTARAGSAFNIYIIADAGALLLIDDLKIYRSDDETKTNILSNGDFESYHAVTSTQYRVSKSFTEMPNTMEAWIKFDADKNMAERGGVILGNLDSYNKSINYEIYTYGRPRVYYVDGNGTVKDYVFNNVNVYNGEWTHLAIVRNSSEKKLECYVNGELKESLACEISDYVPSEPFAISGDLRTSYTEVTTGDVRNHNPYGFMGDLRKVSVYSDARTASEIAGDMTEIGTDNLIASWNLGDVIDPLRIADDSGKGYVAYSWGKYITNLQEDVEKYPYSFAVVGDTQYVNKNDFKDKNVTAGVLDTDYLGGIYEWIISQRAEKNIQFVMGLGDITDHNSAAEWAHAKDAISKLNDAKMRYSLVKGNHDGVRDYSDTVDDTQFDETFNKIYQYDGIYEAPTFDGAGNLLSGTAGNTYHEVEIGDHKYLILAIDHNPSEGALKWAGDVIEAHPDYSVIITIHAYTDAANTFLSRVDKSGYSGEDIWNMLVSKYENVKMVLCGHVKANEISVNYRTGINGNVVTEMVINGQFLDQSVSHGFVSLLRFSEDGERIKVETYGTRYGGYFASTNQFVMELGADGEIYNFDEYLEKNITDVAPYEIQDLFTKSHEAISGAIDSVAKAEAVITAKMNVDVLANAYKLTVGGRQVRAEDNTLRFVLELDDTFYNYMMKNYTDVEFGTLLARGDLYDGVLEYSTLNDGFSTKRATTIKRESTYKPDNYTALNTYGDTTVYTCVVRNIPDAYKDTVLRARSYLKFTDANGDVHYIYGEEYTTTYNDTLAASAQ